VILIESVGSSGEESLKRVNRGRDVKLKRDSWYGELLDHPVSWCGLIWGALWRLTVGVVLVSCAAGFLFVMTVGNYYMITHWNELNSSGVDVDAFMVNLSAAAAAFDITLGIFLIMVVCFNAYRVVPFFNWLASNCPRVEWE